MFSFFSLSNPNPHKKINFEDMQFVLQHPDRFYLIHTLPSNLPHHIIPTTIPANQEETKINALLEQAPDLGLNQEKDPIIIIYGMNASDPTPEKKYAQLRSLHFSDIYIYSGGIFEWLLLQDIYGFKEFPTISTGNPNQSPSPSPNKLPDILLYKGEPILCKQKI
jgi:hypothetical protein